MAETVLAKLAVQIAANTAQFNSALRQSQTQFSSFTNSINSAAASIGLGLGLTALVGVVKSGIDSIKELEQQLATVKAITGATAQEFDQLRASALKLGGSTQFSAKQVAELQTEFGRLGFSVSEILAATEATINLATATGEDLAKAADTAGSTIRAFGLDASQTGRVTDVMAESFNRSALGLENFTEAMKYVAPIARSAGLSLEQTTALLGTLADNGIRGSQAGTSLRKIITDLAKDGRPLAVRLKELAANGLSFAQANDEVGRTAYASLLVLARSTEHTEELTKALNEAEGAAKRAADIVGDTFAGDLKKLSGAYDALIQSAGGTVDILRDFVQATTSVLKAMNSQEQSLGSLTVAWLKLASAVPRGIAYAIGKIADFTNNDIRLDPSQVQGFLKAFNDERNKAIQAGDTEKVKLFTQAIADLTSKYGLLKDKAIEYRDAQAGVNDKTDAALVTIKSLQDKIKDFRETQEEKTSIGDVLGLIKLEKQIEKVELQLINLRNAIAGVRPELAGAADILSTRLQVTGNKKNAIENGIELPNLPGAEQGIGSSFPEFKVPAVDGSAYIKSLKSLTENTNKFVSDTQFAIIDFSGVISSGISDLAFNLGQAAAGVGNFGDSILKAVVGFARQLGEILIGAGTAMLAAKKLITNPYTAIAAGVALVAIAGVASAALNKSQSNFNSGRGNSGSGIVEGAARSDSFQNSNQLLGIVRGQDLYVILQNYNRGRG